MKTHRDFQEENKHAVNTVEHIAAEIERIVPLEQKLHSELTDLIASTGGNYSNDLFIASKVFEMTQRTLLGLKHAVNSPYFTRVDFIPHEKDLQRLYIGKWGVLNPATRTPIIVDWRSNIANLYYTHQVGPAEYQAPYQTVKGEMTLKRMLFFDEGRLKSIIESDIINQGEYLNNILSDHADNKLRDVVTTIQKEQNAVLRCDPKIPAIVQGVAGAGKTTIALHRITWLLYTYRETMSAKNLMVIAPNPLFLDYISAVLPELGVESVLQETFYGLAKKLCGSVIYKLNDNNSLILLLSDNASSNEKDMILSASAFKGSLLYKECLERYIELLPENIFPNCDFMLGNNVIASREKLLTIFTKELSPFPLKPRIKELRKRLIQIADLAEKRIMVHIEYETSKRANYLREIIKYDNELRMKKMKELYASRDKKINEVQSNKKDIVDNYIKEFSSINLMSTYNDFITAEHEFILPDAVSEETWLKVCEYTKTVLDTKSIESIDIPALIILQKKLFGHLVNLDIHHTVLDEAQDFSPFMFDVLKSLTVNESFTIVGDLAQGIYSYRGINNWNEMKKAVFKGKSQFYELITSYRNTIEIMQFAENTADKFASPSRKKAMPVLRHGKKPKVIKYNNKLENLIHYITQMKNEGHKSIALVDKLPADCKKLYKELKEHFPDINLLSDEDTQYSAGVMVVPAHLCKGLEFDCVILTNAEGKTFPGDKLHANLLYVVLTRPLHELVVFYKDRLTPLID